MLGTPQMYEYIYLSTCYKTYFLIFKYYIMKEKQKNDIMGFMFLHFLQIL